MKEFLFKVITEHENFCLGIVWVMALFLLFFYGICFYEKFKKNKGKVVDIYSFLMFLSILSSGFLVLLFSNKAESPSLLTSVLEAFYSSLKLFYADGTAIFSLENSTLNTMYQVLYYVLVFAAPLTLVCTVLSHFDNFINLIKISWYALRPNKNLIIFSELNNKNLAIVENFKNAKLEEQDKSEKNEEQDTKEDINNAFFKYDEFCRLEKNKKIFIFCDVYKENTEASTELIDQANDAGCILLKEDIVSVHKYIRKALIKTCSKKLTRYFLSGADENENVRQAVEIAEMENDSSLKNIALFTFAEQNANGRILEALNTREEFFVLRIKPSVMTAIKILTDRNNWLTTSEKDLNVLILGLGNYGFEIGKFLSWYYQRAKGNIAIHFVDKNENAVNALSGSYNDFFNYKPDLKNPDLNACFNCEIHKGIDVFSEDFTKLLKKIYNENLSESNPGIDAVFCVLGDDNINIKAALHVRKLLDRINYKQLEYININHALNIINKNKAENEKLSVPDVICNAYSYKSSQFTDKIRIFSVIHSDKIKSNLASSKGFIKKCNIDFVGEDSSVYGYNSIFDAKLESIGVRKRETSLLTYNSSEYIRLSSISETLHIEYIESIYPKEDSGDYNVLRCKIGNKRWNAYMLSIGYTSFDVPEIYRKALFELDDQKNTPYPLPMRKWHRGQWHNSIVPYDLLPEEEQKNNYAENRKKK